MLVLVLTFHRTRQGSLKVSDDFIPLKNLSNHYENTWLLADCQSARKIYLPLKAMTAISHVL